MQCHDLVSPDRLASPVALLSGSPLAVNLGKPGSLQAPHRLNSSVPKLSLRLKRSELPPDAARAPCAASNLFPSQQQSPKPSSASSGCSQPETAAINTFSSLPLGFPSSSIRSDSPGRPAVARASAAVENVAPAVFCAPPVMVIEINSSSSSSSSSSDEDVFAQTLLPVLRASSRRRVGAAPAKPASLPPSSPPSSPLQHAITFEPTPPSSEEEDVPCSGGARKKVVRGSAAARVACHTVQCRSEEAYNKCEDDYDYDSMQLSRADELYERDAADLAASYRASQEVALVLPSDSGDSSSETFDADDPFGHFDHDVAADDDTFLDDLDDFDECPLPRGPAAANVSVGPDIIWSDSEEDDSDDDTAKGSLQAALVCVISSALSVVCACVYPCAFTYVLVANFDNASVLCTPFDAHPTFLA